MDVKKVPGGTFWITSPNQRRVEEKAVAFRNYLASVEETAASVFLAAFLWAAFLAL